MTHEANREVLDFGTGATRDGESPFSAWTKTQTNNAYVYGLLDTMTRRAATVAAMKSLSNLQDGETVQTLGYNAACDGGGNMYTYQATGRSGITEDNGWFINASGGGDDYFEAINQDVANVLQFGATADGTTNDSVAIQDAIDAALSDTVNSQTGIVYIPRGSYRLNVGVTATNAKALVIKGDSAPSWDDNDPHTYSGSLLQTADGFSGSVITITTTDAVSDSHKQAQRIENIDIVMSDTASPTRTGYGIEITRGPLESTFSGGDISIVGCCIANGDYGIYVNYTNATCQRLKVDRCLIEKNNYGIYVDGTLTSSVIQNSTIRQNNHWSSGSDYTTFTGGGIALMGRGSPNQNGTNAVTISDVDLEGQQMGVYAYWPRALTIKGCYMEACNTCSISIKGGRTVTIEGCEISGTDANKRVYVQGCRDVYMRNNVNAHFVVGKYNINLETDRPELTEFTTSESTTLQNSGYMLFEIDNFNKLPYINHETLVPMNARADTNSTPSHSSELGHNGQPGRVVRATATSNFGKLNFQWDSAFTVVADEFIVTTVIFKSSDDTIYVTGKKDGSVVTNLNASAFNASDGHIEADKWYACQYVSQIQSGATNHRVEFALATLSGETLDYTEVSTHRTLRPFIRPCGTVFTPTNNHTYINVDGHKFLGDQIPDELSWKVGDLIFDTDPDYDDRIGWVCMNEAGAGHWIGWGVIDSDESSSSSELTGSSSSSELTGSSSSS